MNIFAGNSDEGKRKIHLDGCHLRSDGRVWLKNVYLAKLKDLSIITSFKHQVLIPDRLGWNIMTNNHLKVLLCFDLQVVDQLVEEVRLLFHAVKEILVNKSLQFLFDLHLWKSSSSLVPSTPLILSLINWFAYGTEMRCVLRLNLKRKTLFICFVRPFGRKAILAALFSSENKQLLANLFTARGEVSKHESVINTTMTNDNAQIQICQGSDDHLLSEFT